MKKTNKTGGKFASRSRVSMTTLLLVTLAIALVAALVLLFVVKNSLSSAEPTEPVTEATIDSEMESTVPATQMQEAETSVPSEEDEAEPAETEETEPTETEPDVTIEFNATEPTASKPNSGTSKPGTSKPAATTPAATKPAATEPPVSYLNFPYTIPGTTLVIQKVDSYDGIFLEDGSDRSIEGIYALVLKNTGSDAVEYANITLTQQGKTLTFKATALPAGGTMVVQEANAAAYVNTKFTDCACDIATLDVFEMSENKVSVTEGEKGGLVVKNLTGETIPCIRIFYKFYMQDAKVYVGGITYTAKVTDLAGGESTVINPSHYLADSSALMMVRTYDTAN